MTTPGSSPLDVAELTRLANELFAALPGGAGPPVAPGPDAGPPSSAAEVAIPTDTASASALAGGLAPDAVPAPLLGPPADTLLRVARVASPDVNTPPVPSVDQLASIPDLLGDLLSLVPANPGTTPVGQVPVAPPPAEGPVPMPSAEQLTQAGEWPDDSALAPPVPPIEALEPPTGLGASGFVPDALPGVGAAADSQEAVDDAGSPLGVIPASPSVPPTSSLSVFEFRPEMLPSLSGTSVVARPFDPYAIRRDFPILQERVNGRPLIWLDNGATTQKPQAVIDRVSYYYEHENSNIHRAAHTLAARSTDAYEGAREKARRFLNASSASEIVFVRGATEAINLVAKTWGAANVGSGDEILVTHLEHHANIVPWQQLAQQAGATLKVAPVDDSGQIILSEYERLVTPRTKLVAMTQVSNALGTITPTAEMVAIARRRGAVTLVDAAQSVLHMPVDVQALDADFLVFSGHKVFAPTGIGVVYGKADVWADTPPWQGGGNMIADVTFERTVYQPPPNRFEAGTGNIADAVGLGAALDYVTAVGLHNIEAYEQELLEYGTAGLRTIPGLRLIGTATHKAAVLSFVLDGHSPQDVGAALDRDGIAVRAGHHCAQPILRRFGVEATVRPSLAMYNTREDLDCLVDALRRLQAGQVRGA